MQRILGFYVSVSISASAIILFLLAAGPLWKRRLSRTWQYYIWLLAVLRLLIPLSPFPGIAGRAEAAGFYGWAGGTVQTALHRARPGGIAKDWPGEAVKDWPSEAAEDWLGGDAKDWSGEAAKDRPGGAAKDWLGGDAKEGEPQVLTPSGEGNTSLDQASSAEGESWLSSRLWLVWLLPAVLILAHRIFGYRRYLRLLKSVSRPVREGPAVEVCRRVREELGIRRGVSVCYCKAAVSPMAAGLTAPRVFLPEDACDPSRLYYIFRHELTHFKRRDLLYKWLVELAVCIHWFNPLVYALRRQCAKACELACDEAVVSGLPAEGRAAYGDTLMASIKGACGRAKAPAPVHLCDNTRVLKERLEAVMKTRKATALQRAAALGITVFLVCLALLLGEPAVRAEEESSSIPDSRIEDSKNSGSKKEKRGVMVSGFFANGYGIKLGWNRDPSLYETTRRIQAEDTYTVSFTEETGRHADDPRVLEAVRQSILRRRQHEKEKPDSSWVKNYVMKQPVVVEVDGPYEGTYDELAVRFYDEEKIDYYFDVLRLASRETQKTLLERSYREDSAAYFSTASELLTDEEQKQYLQKSYRDDRIAFFSMLTDETEEVRRLVEQAYQDRRISFFSVGFSGVPTGEQKSYAYRSYEEDRIDFFSIAVDSLDASECEALAKRAAQERKVTFLYVIPGVGGEE